MLYSWDICDQYMKVLLIEDELKTGQSIKSYLQEECKYEVIWHNDGLAGLKTAKENNFDIILSDIIMPGMDGITLCSNLREFGIKTPILILSALYQPEDKVQGLNAGADDYLAKPFDFGELLARINALVRRSVKSKETSVLSFSDITINLSSMETIREGQKINLTPKEFALLEYFLRNSERVISKQELLEKVWNLTHEISTNVIEVYVNYLRNKIDKGFSKRLIHTHFGIGYVLREE
ncbi:MAG: response regulator transcription factor [Saprospiraceae bacterium]|jgi:two-component system copper resistance phosphate regulon response regulator CusR